MVVRHKIAFMRHTSEHDPGPGIAITTWALDYPRNAHVKRHAHSADQLVYATRGVMEVSSGKKKVWMIPPHFGLWIPARTLHEIRMSEPVSMRTLYLRPGMAKLPAECAVLHVSPLLREVISEIVRLGRIRMRSRIECAYRDVLVSLLERASPVPTGIWLPEDERALAVATAVLGGGAYRRNLISLCQGAGVSVRTVQRSFRREVGMDFESWRRQVRLMKATELLIAGRSVKEASYAVGYRQQSAFVAVFRKTFGATPKGWVRTLERLS